MTVDKLRTELEPLELVRQFLLSEYGDPACEVDGHFLAPEARPAWDALHDAFDGVQSLLLRIDGLTGLLEGAILQLEYLDGRLPTGTTPGVIAQIRHGLSQ